VIFDSNGEQFGKADTFTSALRQVEECWGEAWLNGNPVLPPSGRDGKEGRVI
jgi:hypothetical protein